MALVSIRQLLREVPSTDNIVRHEGTGWVRVTVVQDDGTVFVVDAKKEHVRRLTSTTQVA